MRVFTLNAIASIQDFQFLTDSSGYVLAQGGQLYRFSGNQTVPVATPPHFTVTQFHFLDATHGAVAGNFRPEALPLRQGSVGAAALLPLVLGLLWLLMRRFGPGQRGWPGLAGVVLTGGLLFGCGRAWQQYRTPDPTREGVTSLSRNRLTQHSLHQYVGNKGQRAFIALTHSAGVSWETRQIPSNFYVTALTAIGRNFLVGTYANPYEGASPLHADGDVWIYGQDPTLSPELARNTAAHPYGLTVRRGIRGFSFSATGQQLFIFGSERMPAFPPDEISATPGNIYELPVSLRPPYRLLDVPDTVEVTSLAQADTGELWATLDNRKVRLFKGILRYVSVPSRQLLQFTQGRWQPVALPQAQSFGQVTFVAGTGKGYLLTEAGQVLVTSNSGAQWLPTALHDIRRMKSGKQAIMLQRGANQLLVLSAELPHR